MSRTFLTVLSDLHQNGNHDQEQIRDTTNIAPGQLAELFQTGKRIELIDVRTPVEYREIHVENARNAPLYRLDPAALMQARNGSGP